MSASHRRPRVKKWKAALAASSLLAASGSIAMITESSAATVPLSGPFYNSPDQNVDLWVKNNPTDSRTPVIKRIAGQPAAVWLGGWSSRADVTKTVNAAAANGTTPVFVFYNITNRDCGGYSSGGAPTLSAYDTWVRDMAAGLGTRQAAVILEPDSLAASCWNDGRVPHLGTAAAAIHAANPKAKVYFDIGHSQWNSAATMASRARQAGILTNGDGIVSNVSNFQTTASEVTYDKAILSALGNADLRAVVDTSRNGGTVPPAGTWCNPSGTKIGRNPSTATGDAKIDAFLWVKLAGESDGPCNGAPSAGTFSPALAYSLANGAPASPADPAPTPTPTPTPTVTPPTSPPPTCGQVSK